MTTRTEATAAVVDEERTRKRSKATDKDKETEMERKTYVEWRLVEWRWTGMM